MKFKVDCENDHLLIESYNGNTTVGRHWWVIKELFVSWWIMLLPKWISLETVLWIGGILIFIASFAIGLYIGGQ